MLSLSYVWHPYPTFCYPRGGGDPGRLSSRIAYYVYILCSQKNGTLYVGVTNDLERRLYEHKNKLIKGFSKKYNTTCLVYAELYEDIKEAIYREKCLKKWKRAWKIRLIEESNPEWRDLCQG